MAKADSQQTESSKSNQPHGRIKRHYFRLMPDNPRHRSIIWSIFWIVAAILIVQLIYPTTRTLPVAYWQGQQHGNQDELSIAADITNAFEATKVRLKTDQKSIEVPLATLGAEPQIGLTIDQLSSYPFWQRYVPLSILWPKSVDQTSLVYAGAIAKPACEQYANKLSYQPVNASLELKDGKLKATNDKDGAVVDPKALCQQLYQQSVKLGQTFELKVKAESVPAEQTSADFAVVAEQARNALERPVSFSYEQQQYSPEPAEQARWLRLDSDDDKQTILKVDSEAVKKYLSGISSKIGRPPGQTNIKIVNGIEVGREIGEPGREIDYQPAIMSIERQLLGLAEVQPVHLALRDIAPKIIYNSRYTATQEGLQAYVNDAARQYNARISIQQLDGEMWRAAAREYESIPSASTYKLYVAMKLFDEMKQGRIGWNDSILGTTVSTCFNRMTIASTNQCAEEWLRQFGRSNVNQFLYDRGFSHGTSFTHPTATHTTAADLTSYMVRLARGELYDDVYKQRLLASLGGHPYPYGVPAGSAGKVYDKVGFLWDYVHDTAIVEHPRGRYVVTIMTKGQSYARIASITREIERLMYP